jgi:hypothetical protein
MIIFEQPKSKQMENNLEVLNLFNLAELEKLGSLSQITLNRIKNNKTKKDKHVNDLREILNECLAQVQTAKDDL